MNSQELESEDFENITSPLVQVITTEPDKISDGQEILSENQSAISEKNILEKIEDLKNEVLKRSQFDHFKDDSIQRMTKQIEAFEYGIMREIKDTLLKDIIVIYDSIERFQTKFSYIEDSKLSNDLELLKEEVEELLFRNDVDKIEIVDSEIYNRDLQKVLKKEPTEIETENGLISKVFRQGFKISNRVLRKQEIIVKEYISKTA